MSEGLTLEQRTQVQQGAVRLHREFAGTFGEETIERLVADSLQQLATARYQAFVPMLAERFARERLLACAKVATGDPRGRRRHRHHGGRRARPLTRPTTT